MLYIETLSSNKIDFFLDRFDALERLEFNRRNIVGRLNILISLLRILYSGKVDVVFISEERVEFRLLSRIFSKVEFRVVHLGLLFGQRLRLSHKAYKTLYPSIISLFFRGINGLNAFKKHYVFYEENIAILKANNPKCNVELVPVNITLNSSNPDDLKCILLIPSAWSHHGHMVEEEEQWENFRTLSDYFDMKGYKVFIKPHPRGNSVLLFELINCSSCCLNVIQTTKDYPGSIVIGNISTLLVDMHLEGYDVYKSLTGSMITFNNRAIDKLKNIDLLIKK